MITIESLEEIKEKTRPILEERLVKEDKYIIEGNHIRLRGDFYEKQIRIALKNCGITDPQNIEEYIAMDGYFALGKILRDLSPKEVIDIMKTLREQGHRVVVLSNTNALHTTFWPDEYPQIYAAADHVYLSQEMGMRKPEARIYQRVLELEGFSAADAVFFDDNADNIEGANQLGITSVLVTGRETLPNYFMKSLC